MKPRQDSLGQEKVTNEILSHRLRLFVAGNEPNSIRAREVVSRLCEAHLKGRYRIRVVDVLEDYQAAIDHHVMVVPSLIVERPAPVKTIVGSLRDEGKVLEALGIFGKGEGA